MTTQNEPAESCIACAILAEMTGKPYVTMHTMMHVDRNLAVVNWSEPETETT